MFINAVTTSTKEVMQAGTLILVVMIIIAVGLIVGLATVYFNDRQFKKEVDQAVKKKYLKADAVIHKITLTNTCSRCLMFDKAEVDRTGMGRCMFYDKTFEPKFGCYAFVSTKHDY